MRGRVVVGSVVSGVNLFIFELSCHCWVLPSLPCLSLQERQAVSACLSTLLQVGWLVLWRVAC